MQAEFECHISPVRKTAESTHSPLGMAGGGGGRLDPCLGVGLFKTAPTILGPCSGINNKIHSVVLRILKCSRDRQTPLSQDRWLPYKPYKTTTIVQSSTPFRTTSIKLYALIRTENRTKTIACPAARRRIGYITGSTPFGTHSSRFHVFPDIFQLKELLLAILSCD